MGYMYRVLGGRGAPLLSLLLLSCTRLCGAGEEMYIRTCKEGVTDTHVRCTSQSLKPIKPGIIEDPLSD